MAAIVNGMAVHGGLIPYGATFLVFSDYMRGAIRVSALSHIPSIWIFTHDSIGLGEDGPTHQPVEHLPALRVIPNLSVIRPCDANETAEAWRHAITNRKKPTALLLTRQALPILERGDQNRAGLLKKGAYIFADYGQEDPRLIFMASGSEVSLVIEAARILEERGISTRVVSFPSWDLFEETETSYQESVLPKRIRKRIAVEAAIGQGWEKYTGDEGKILAMQGFGASAPYQQLFEKFGFTREAIAYAAEELLKEKE